MTKFLQTKLMKRFLFFASLMFITSAYNLTAQTGAVKGKIEDSETGETLIGATVLIQGTNKGAITDVDGNYVLGGIAPGDYNLVVSYVSYEQIIERIQVNKNAPTVIDFKLKPASVQVNEVRITANKRTDTEIAMISGIKSSNLVVSGISKQQIARSQDKDASEVISRVPGVTVRDGRFINVRGLDERYNVVLMNGVQAPSSESDRRAFSFDMIPSSLIDNLLLYKTPAPEIPADFAGAVVLIQTKNTVDNNSIDISYGTGYRSNTTFKDFYTYRGGKTDWLGFDDGTRGLPNGFPETQQEFRNLADNPDEADKARLTELGQSFNKIWSPEIKRSIPDQSFSVTLNRKFLLGKVSVGNTTSIGYSVGDQYREVFRAGYQTYDYINDRPDTAYFFNDDIYSTKTKLNGLSNWLFVFGNNQKIEFRNFYNQYSDKQTILRDGRDNYGGIDKGGVELSFQSRMIYTGQIGGAFNWRDTKSNLNWTVGYSYTNKEQPDIRRIEMNKNEDSDDYSLSFNFNADPKMIGRLFLYNHENIYVGSLNYGHKFQLGNLTPEFTTGVLFEDKHREFVARNIGYAISNVLGFNWSLAAMPIDSVFQDKNINFTNGIKIDESTDPTDSYSANNRLFAGYAAINVPFGKFKLHTGVRLEKNNQTLESNDRAGAGFSINNNYLDFFPSANLTYNINGKSLVRFAYGRTINRPEFREISQQAYYDFEEKATIYGNPSLTNAYIQNADLRYEWFPYPGDLITIGGFYKRFKNPIEAHLIEAGSGRNYTFANAELAESYGMEIDIRKSFIQFENSDNLLRSLRHMVVVFNLALIESKLRTNDPDAREDVRQMQGQSPYIINTGLFYENPKNGLIISVLYNIIGPRLMYVGDNRTPHIIQMPRNLIDITLNKKITEKITLKLGVKDLFNQPVELRQNERIQLYPGVSDDYSNRVQRTQVYKPSNSFTAGISVSL
ncbi:MAG: TonB-dependent receptor [Bacteroidales bacterium]|nr:TonB-dependent receptor [Bacteroidales bacterium]